MKKTTVDETTTIQTQEYFFPIEGVTIKATSQEEALRILKGNSAKESE